MSADPGVVVGDDLEVAVAAFAYRGTLRRALARLKYGGARRLARPLAAAAVPVLGPALQAAGMSAEGIWLVPVPVHEARLRQRGYNQAAELARALAQPLGGGVTDILVRARPTTQQHRLSRAERLRNLRAAFQMSGDASAPPAAVLVDDILTTSATLEACAGVLRAAGTQRVVGIAIAREV